MITKAGLKLPLVIKIIILFLAYFITARLGLSLDPVGGFATLVWPPTGIALTALLLFSGRLWPGIFFGALLVNLTTGAPPLVAFTIACGNTLEAIIAVYLLKRFTNFNPKLERLQDALALIILAAIFSPLVSATIGSLSLLFGTVIKPSAFMNTWLAWWIGDMLGVLVVGSLLLVWLSQPRFKFKLKRFLEATLILSFLILVDSLIFTNSFQLPVGHPPLTYLLFPPMIWLVLRFGVRESTLAIFLISIFSIWTTTRGLGPFASNSLSESLTYLQLFIGTTSITFIIFSAIVSERKTLEKRKDEFISIASHELKTPITTIKGYIDLLKLKKGEYRKASQYIDRIDDQVKRLINLINEMLDVTRIGSDKITLQYESFSINKLVREIIKDIQKTSPNHKITLDADKKEVTISADKFRIGQVLFNLISNGIKFSKEKQKLIIKIQPKSRAIIISVQDIGIGIPKEYQNQIFERFFQAHSNNELTQPGLGLGLYICAEIIRLHNGQIWVESRDGKGSTFSFRIPIKN